MSHLNSQRFIVMSIVNTNTRLVLLIGNTLM